MTHLIGRQVGNVRNNDSLIQAEMAARYCAETTVTDWAARLVCGKCGSRRVEMVVSGGEAVTAYGDKLDPRRKVLWD